MTSLASFLASLAGAAPQQGQKAIPANASGAGGLFAALLATAETTRTAEGEGEAAAAPLGLAPGIPTPEISPADALADPVDALLTDPADGQADAAPGDTPGEASPAGDIEALIVDAPPAGQSGSEGVQASITLPDTGVMATVDGQPEVQDIAPSADGETPVTAPQAAAASQPAADGAPVASAQARPDTDDQVRPEPAARPTGLENALGRASEQGRQNGLQTALGKAPQAHGKDDAQARPGKSEGLGDAARPGAPVASEEPPAPKPGQGRPEFAPRDHQTIQRIINTGNGLTQIRIQERTGGETAGPTSPPTLTVNVQASAASPGAASPNTPHVPVSALAVHIAQQASNGARRFDIRLDPPELGRIEVRLDVSRDGQVMTHLVVERAETLDLLQRDARHLERALQDAGLNTSEDGMKFSLKDQGLAHGGQDQFGENGDDSATPANGTDDSSSQPADDAMSQPVRYSTSAGLDIRI